MSEESRELRLHHIADTVSRRFSVHEWYIEEGTPTFLIDSDSPHLKEYFEQLVHELRNEEYLPVLRERTDGLVIKVVPRPETDKGSNRTPIILLLATIAVVFIHGYMLGSDPLWSEFLTPDISPIIHGITFTIALLGIIGTHELGHLTILRKNAIESSLPYFIPGIPGLGFLAPPTFGAVIVQKEIPPNKDRLFDLGVSGPIFGLVATIIVAVVSSLIAPALSEQRILELQAQGIEFSEVPCPTFPIPALLQIIMSLLMPSSEGTTVVIPLIFSAAWVGMLVTFLNALPAWQLDGGHLARAVLGRRAHTYTTLASIALMTLIGFWFMAFLVLVLWVMSGGRTAAPLDDYSSVSPDRKLLFAVILVVAALSAPLPFPIL